MFITLETDYAVRIVYCLARSGKRTGASEISESTGVTLRFALKILHKLVANGIVRSFKGAKGGYELARTPGEITLREVVEVMEGPIVFSRCLTDGFVCTNDVEGRCFFNGVYEKLSNSMREQLEGVRFSDALKK